MRILDTERFVPYSDAIEKIIRSHTERLGESPISDEFALYSVDSHVQIELQERLALE